SGRVLYPGESVEQELGVSLCFPRRGSLVSVLFSTGALKDKRFFFGSSVLKCEAWDFSLFCRSQSFCYHASGDVSDHGGAMARITIDVDLTPEVEITGYQRYQDGHGLEVRWPLPARCRCEKCGHDDVAHIEFKTMVLPF